MQFKWNYQVFPFSGQELELIIAMQFYVDYGNDIVDPDSLPIRITWI